MRYSTNLLSPYLFHFYIICFFICFFFFNDTATTEIYTLSLHDALPISKSEGIRAKRREIEDPRMNCPSHHRLLNSFGDRKSTRLNSSHTVISYAVFCLKKKKKKKKKNKHKSPNIYIIK